MNTAALWTVSCYAQVTALATSLQLSVAQAQLLVSKQPLLLNLSAKTLTQRVSDLADVLGLPPRVLAKLVTAKPSVMLFNPNKMRTKSIRLQCIAGKGREAHLSVLYAARAAVYCPSSCMNQHKTLSLPAASFSVMSGGCD